MKRFSRSLKYVYLGLMLLFLYLPILYLIVFSFNDFSVGRRISYANLGRWNGFSLANYTTIFQGEAGSALLLSLEIALISSIIATVIGTAAAIGIHSMKKRPRSIILNLSQLPMVNPDLVTGITFMMLFAFVNSLLAKLSLHQISDIIKLLIAHISFSIPYVIFSVMPRLRQSSNLLYEAAMDLGCSPMQALLKAVIPDILPHQFRLYHGAHNVARRFCGQLLCLRSSEHAVGLHLLRSARCKRCQPRACHRHLHSARDVAADRQFPAYPQGARG